MEDVGRLVGEEQRDLRAEVSLKARSDKSESKVGSPSWQAQCKENTALCADMGLKGSWGCWFETLNWTLA